MEQWQVDEIREHNIYVSRSQETEIGKLKAEIKQFKEGYKHILDLLPTAQKNDHDITWICKQALKEKP